MEEKEKGDKTKGERMTGDIGTENEESRLVMEERREVHKGLQQNGVCQLHQSNQISFSASRKTTTTPPKSFGSPLSQVMPTPELL